MFANSFFLYTILVHTFFIRATHSTPLHAVSELRAYHVEAHPEIGSYFWPNDLNTCIQDAWRQHIHRQSSYSPLTPFHILRERIDRFTPGLLVHFEVNPSYSMTYGDADTILEQVIRQIPRRGPNLNLIHWTVRQQDHPGSPLIARGVAVGNPNPSIASARYPLGLGTYHLRDLARAFRTASRTLQNPWEELKRVDRLLHINIRVQPNLPVLVIRINHLPQPPRSNQYLIGGNLRVALLLAAQKMDEDSVPGRQETARGFSCTILQLRKDASNPGATGVVKVARLDAGQLVGGVGLVGWGANATLGGTGADEG